MPSLIRPTPEYDFAAGELVEISVPVTLAGSVTLADFDTFEMPIWEDPDYPRQGADAAVPIDPAGSGWTEAATLDGDASGDTVTYTGTLPTGAGVRRYVFAAWGLGGTAGPACLVRPTWLTLVPGR
jgi:hypothetical protein